MKMWNLYTMCHRLYAQHTSLSRFNPFFVRRTVYKNNLIKANYSHFSVGFTARFHFHRVADVNW